MISSCLDLCICIEEIMERKRRRYYLTLYLPVNVETSLVMIFRNLPYLSTRNGNTFLTNI